VAPTHKLTATGFRMLATVPPEIEWLANLGNAATRRAYRADVRDFMGLRRHRPASGLR
jgi:hypothetical protein